MNPVIFECEYKYKENSMTFGINGSLEWLEEMVPFLSFNLGIVLGTMEKLEPDAGKETTEQRRQESVAALEALKRRESYAGQFIKLNMREANDEQRANKI